MTKGWRVFFWAMIGLQIAFSLLLMHSVLYGYRSWLFVLGTPIAGVAMMSRILWLDSGNRQRVARAKLGQCLFCGYDLRSSPQTCPECGVNVSTKGKA